MSSGDPSNIDNWLNNQKDPSEYSTEILVDGSNKLVGVESEIANVEQQWAAGAAAATNYFDGVLNDAVTAMSGVTGDNLQWAQAQFQALQTSVSNIEQNYGNVVQGGTTVLNSTQQAASQFNNLANVPIGQKSYTNNLILGWG